MVKLGETDYDYKKNDLTIHNSHSGVAFNFSM